MRQIIFNKIIFSGSIIFLLFLSIGDLKAQDTIQYKKNEIWANFFSPGVTYKRGLNSRTFFKAGITFDFNKGKSDRNSFYSDDNYNSFEHFNVNQNNQSISLNLGIEKRSYLSPKVTLFHGPDLSYGFSVYRAYTNNNLNSNDETSRNTQTIGAGYTIGAVYSFNSYLGIGVNWSPRIYYSFYKSETSYRSNIDPHTNRMNTNKDKSLGIQLTTPSVNLILKF
ncbi:MAG: hypothetical protein NVV82_04435 [Sporocytophaga sp.]|nr:hypothetical protein [Sporocytophaga sp.]